MSRQTYNSNTVTNKPHHKACLKHCNTKEERVSSEKDPQRICEQAGAMVSQEEEWQVRRPVARKSMFIREAGSGGLEGQRGQATKTLT